MAKFGIGQPLRRVEDRRFLTGAGRYVADIDLPRQLHALFLRPFMAGAVAVAAPATVMNALMDALAPAGVTRLDMPATPLAIWQALQAAKQG
jgi:CO/xanthine dehydrogenase Mo-binding subunit